MKTFVYILILVAGVILFVASFSFEFRNEHAKYVGMFYCFLPLWVTSICAFLEYKNRNEE